MAADLADLAALVHGELEGPPGIEVVDLSYDSRKIEDGMLFCCLPGRLDDGHAHASAAVAAGASALLCERQLDVAVPQIVVADARTSMALLADAILGHPSRDLTVVGVTGTNGKTTITHLLHAVCAMSGMRAAVLGTLAGTRTTPESPDLQRWLAAQRAIGTEVVAMEVSSHAMEMHRVDATRFAVAVFSNLSRDHLDFHPSMEAYFQAKARLFTPEHSERAVVNLDSPYGRLLKDAATIPTVGYSMSDVDDLEVGAGSSRFVWRGQAVELSLGGRFNVSNALAAAETALLLGLDPTAIAAGLSTPIVVPGRFEVIDEGQPFSVVVDYAHTPDGLEQVLLAAREVAGAARVLVVFGCGGDRDPTKRAPMGEVAARLADRVVLTADNSREEDTEAIIAAVREGFDSAQARSGALVIEPDRGIAIDLALRAAGPGDVVVIAGKGHETTIEMGSSIVDFDDRVVARGHLRRLIGSTNDGTDAE